jgi:hypothetical protein
MPTHPTTRQAVLAAIVVASAPTALAQPPVGPQRCPTAPCAHPSAFARDRAHLANPPRQRALLSHWPALWRHGHHI